MTVNGHLLNWLISAINPLNLLNFANISCKIGIKKHPNIGWF